MQEPLVSEIYHFYGVLAFYEELMSTTCRASMPIAAVVYGAMLIVTGNLTGVSILEDAALCSNRY